MKRLIYISGVLFSLQVQAQEVWDEVDSLLMAEGYDLSDTAYQYEIENDILSYLPEDTSAKHLYKNGYAAIDKFAISVGPKHNDIGELSLALTSKFSSDADKVRSIFRWMTEYISYDCEMYHNMPEGKTYKNPTKQEWDAILVKEDKDLAKKTLKNKKGVCEGYSVLFVELCRASGIECEKVSGHVIKSNGAISGHAWNSVKIDGKSFLVDVTWASGYADKAVKVFTKEFDGFYYLTPSNEFIKTHLPDEDRNQFLPKPLTKQQFASINGK